MYIIAIVENDVPTKYVCCINYTKQFWESGSKPKIFKTKKSAKRCFNQIKTWGKNIPLVMYKIIKED